MFASWESVIFEEISITIFCGILSGFNFLMILLITSVFEVGISKCSLLVLLFLIYKLQFTDFWLLQTLLAFLRIHANGSVQEML